MSRKDIRGADYNPRVIDDTARERLMENVRRRGLMGPALIVNGRTSTLVSGHQRLSVLDTLEGRDDYMIDVTVVSLTDEEEREQNVFLNNPHAMGAFDLDVLRELVDAGLSADGMGFDVTELAILLDDPDIGAPAATGAAIEIGQEVNAIDEARKRSARETMAGARDDVKRVSQQRDDVEHYVTFVFRTDADATAAMEAVGLDPEQRYHDGSRLLALAKR